MGAPARPLAERIQEKIEVDPASGCWLWTGSLGGGGYASISIGKRGRALVHRLSYEMHKGPIPEGLQIDHLCRVRRCVNPDHLEPVTHAQNARRGSLATKTHCKNGHEYTPENTRISKDGSRHCRACGREAYWQRRDRVRGQRMEFRARRKEARQRGEPAPKIVRPLATHCKHGHPFDEANTQILPKGKRACRECKRIAAHKNFELRRAGLLVDVPVGPEILSPGVLDLRTHDQNVAPPPPAKATHCVNGHPYDEANTRIDKHGFRGCRACSRAKTAAKRARERAAPDYTAPVRVKASHCLRGHPFDEANTFIQSNGARGCRICRRLHGAAYKERKKAAVHRETADKLREVAA